MDARKRTGRPCRSLSGLGLFCLMLSLSAGLLPASESRADGRTVWVTTVRSAERDNLSLYQLAAAHDGNVYAAGTAYTGVDPATSFLPVLVKLDANGRVLWQKIIAETDNAIIVGVGSDGTGAVHVAGTLFDATGTRPFEAVFSADGARLSLHTFADARLPYVLGMAVDWGGHVYLVGTDASRRETRMWVAKLTGRGTIEWKREFGSGEGDEVIAVATDARGDVLVCGRESATAGEPTQAWLAKLHWNGALVWKKAIPERETPTACYDVAAAGASGIVVGGETCDASGCRFLVGRLDADGEPQWMQPAGDGLITADRQGAAYAVADAAQPALVHYSAAGDRTWSQQLPTVPLAMVGNASAAYASGMSAGGASWVAMYADGR